MGLVMASHQLLETPFCKKGTENNRLKEWGKERNKTSSPQKNGGKQEYLQMNYLYVDTEKMLRTFKLLVKFYSDSHINCHSFFFLVLVSLLCKNAASK